MLISMVIFAFGLIISFIVMVGMLNAREFRARQRAYDLLVTDLPDESHSASAPKTPSSPEPKGNYQVA